VDRLEAELGSKGLQVIRLNVQDPAGREMSERLRAMGVPTFILFDASGREVWRQVGVIDPQKVRVVMSGG